MAVFLILIGPPGAGKGTQAERLEISLGVPHISSGNIFREHLTNKTELGQAAEMHIAKGELVPDRITIGMIEERLSQPDVSEGAILDGFPRTIAQADALDRFLEARGENVDPVIYLNTSDEEVLRRLTGRRVCRAEGHIYHAESKPPQRAGICDEDGSDLYQRDDDREETVKERLRVYRVQTAPLIDHYQERGVLLEIVGEQSMDSVTDRLKSVTSVRASG
ncbi:MAG: adenylate kinase [Anaerolineales bacterium]|nr:adenylate kinase [Anaerolineales bacterium]TET96330.1 MAG: adenylate kinase [Anaerolineales bacterium]